MLLFIKCLTIQESLEFHNFRKCSHFKFCSQILKLFMNSRIYSYFQIFFQIQTIFKVSKFVHKCKICLVNLIKCSCFAKKCKIAKNVCDFQKMFLFLKCVHKFKRCLCFQNFLAYFCVCV